MRTLANKPLISLSVLLFLSACTMDAHTELPDPLGIAKADITDQVNLRGSIGFGEFVQGEFVDDLQYEAFSFSAREGATIKTEVTRAGTASALDDFIMLYGVGTAADGYEDATRLVSDDDSGWGRHGRIEGFELPSAGSYLIVVGTKDGLGRGRFQVGLECVSGNCALRAPPATDCDDGLFSYINECVERETYESGEGPEWAFEYCAGEAKVVGEIAVRCASATPADYCELTAPELREQMVPACRAEVGFGYGLTLGPLRFDSSNAFSEYAGNMNSHEAVTLFELDFQGSSGPRMIRESALSHSLQQALISGTDANDLLDDNEDWLDLLSTEDEGPVELEWSLSRIVEVWQDNGVIGYAGLEEAAVSRWQESDADDPVTYTFYVVTFLDVEGEHVRTLYAQY